MQENNVKILIQEKIIYLLNTSGMSMRSLSMQLGMSDGYISQILNNEMLPSLRIIIALCDYYNMPLKDFFDESVKYPPEYYNLLVEIQRLSVSKMNGLYILLHGNSEECTLTYSKHKGF